METPDGLLLVRISLHHRGMWAQKIHPSIHDVKWCKDVGEGVRVRWGGSTWRQSESKQEKGWKTKKTVRTAGRQLQINVMEINIHTENNILISSTKIQVQFWEKVELSSQLFQKTKSTPDVAAKRWRWRGNGKQTETDVGENKHHEWRSKQKTQLGSKFDDG